MNKMTRLLLAVALFYAPFTYGYETIEIENLEDVVTHVQPNSLVIFGGLNTLFKTQDPGRWPYQKKARIQYMKDHCGYHKSKTAAEADWRALHPFSPEFLPAVEGIGAIIEGIRATGSKVVCITGLPQKYKVGRSYKNVNDAITQCLAGCNVDLAADWEGLNLDASEQFTTTTPFLNGVIHAQGADRSELLDALIALIADFNFENIVVIDDEAEKLEDYGVAADILSGIDPEVAAPDAVDCCKCLLFRKLHEAPEDFKLPKDIKALLSERKGHITEEKQRALKKAKREAVVAVAPADDATA